MIDGQEKVSIGFEIWRHLSETPIITPLRAWYHPTVYYLTGVWLWIPAMAGANYVFSTDCAAPLTRISSPLS